MRQHQAARVARHRGCREARHFRIGDLGLRAQRLRHAAQTAAEHDDGFRTGGLDAGEAHAAEFIVEILRRNCSCNSSTSGMATPAARARRTGSPQMASSSTARPSSKSMREEGL